MKIIVDDLTEEKRIDTFLAEYLQDFSRTKLQNEIKSGNILINSKIIKPSYIINPGDIIEYNTGNLYPSVKAENIPLDIVWEDENIAVVNKPSGMLTHPTSTETTNTLVNALLYKYKNNLSDINGDFRRGIIHRLDRNTSGLLIIAKNNTAHEFIAEKIKQKQIHKYYLAVIKGQPEQNDFIINKPIGRNPKQQNKMCVIDSGKESISIVKVLKRFKDASLVEVQIITGRTHQIRVHMAHIGHPVYNDTLYGFGKMKIKTEEQVLQSYKISFPKPFTEEYINLEIKPDNKIQKIIKYLESTQLC